jgi:hypothetical protein
MVPAASALVRKKVSVIAGEYQLAVAIEVNGFCGLLGDPRSQGIGNDWASGVVQNPVFSPFVEPSPHVLEFHRMLL